jgi:hypothetical protein
VAVASAIAVVVLWPKQALTPEDEVRALVARLTASLEAKDPSALRDELADSFQASGMGPDEVKRYAAGLLLRGPEAVVVMNPRLAVQLAPGDDAATFEGTFLLSRPLGPDGMTQYEVTATASKTPSGWKLRSARWTH